MTLASGYTALPPGKLANVVTCLEMREAPPPHQSGAEGLSLERLDAHDLAGYRALFKRIGEDWMWFSRLIMRDEDLSAILASPQVESYALIAHGARTGIMELDFRTSGECELSFFGVVREAIGKGAGRYLMNEAIARAWARPITRLWVHTCTFDSPQATPFYVRSGFTPYQYMVEIHDDPRISGHLPRTACPHIPIIA